jgi:hypothetical protein
MRERPYTLLSCCVSIDGYIGKAASRLFLSNDADFDRVDAVRASCDAILVGRRRYESTTRGSWCVRGSPRGTDRPRAAGRPSR